MRDLRKRRVKCVGDRQLHVWISRRWHERLVRLAQERETTKAQLVRVAVKAMVDGLV